MPTKPSMSSSSSALSVEDGDEEAIVFGRVSLGSL